MANRYYNPVGTALRHADTSIGARLDALGRSHIEAARFKEEQEEKKRMEPLLQARIKEANNFLDQQKWLDEPATFADIFGNLGTDYKDYEKRHFIENDIPGAVMQSMGATFDENSGRAFIGDKVVTRRMVGRNAPMISGIIDAKTSARKLVQDKHDYIKNKIETNAALTEEEAAIYPELQKAIKDPFQQHLLKEYDAKEERLLLLKGKLQQMGGDTTVIDQSLARVSRKRKETLDMIQFNKQLNQQLQIANARIGGKTKPIVDFEDMSKMYEMHLDNLVDAFVKRQEGGIAGFKPLINKETGQPYTIDDYYPSLQMQAQRSLASQLATILPALGVPVNKGKGAPAPVPDELVDPSISEYAGQKLEKLAKEAKEEAAKIKAEKIQKRDEAKNFVKKQRQEAERLDQQGKIPDPAAWAKGLRERALKRR